MSEDSRRFSIERVIQLLTSASSNNDVIIYNYALAIAELQKLVLRYGAKFTLTKFRQFRLFTNLGAGFARFGEVASVEILLDTRMTLRQVYRKECQSGNQSIAKNEAPSMLSIDHLYLLKFCFLVSRAILRLLRMFDVLTELVARLRRPSDRTVGDHFREVEITQNYEI